MSNGHALGRRRSAVLPYAVAFSSGLCALVYEIVWMRAFTPIFGLSIYATTAVLCAFMAGLGLGSVFAPVVLRRWRGSPWWLYALLELGIGLGAAIIPFTTGAIAQIFSAVAGIDQWGGLTSMVRFGLSFAVMLAPTLFMGMTLPVLVHAFRDVAAEDPVSGRRVGMLYGLNTVGGAAGCLLVGFVLIERLGVRATTFTTAFLNFSLAIVVISFLARRRSSDLPTLGETEAIEHGPGGSLESGRALPMSAILILYALIGFTSFGYEMVWFRILVFFLQSATYSFSIMLTVFLLGLGSGSLFFSRFLEPRLDPRASLGTAKALALTQMGLGLFGLATFHLYSHLTSIWTFVLSLLGASSWLVIALQKAVIGGLIILPPTFLMGITFPLVVRLYKARGAGDAQSAGHLYAVNTAGAIIGILITAFVLFDALGVQKTMTVLSGASFVIGLVFAVRPSRLSGRFRLFPAVAASGFALLLIATPQDMLKRQFEKVHGEIFFYRESAADISFVHRVGENDLALAFNDGRGVSSTQIMNNHVNRMLAYSTMLVNPDAKDVLVISMGCGNTASAYTKFPIRRLDIVDISSGPFEAARFFWTNEGVLNDPRVHTHVEDGRNYLLRSGRTYDIIQLELPTLHTDGVVNLYTREFYEIARSRLNPGGVLSQWVDATQTEREPSYMVFNTMREVFPNTTMWAVWWAWWGNGVKGERDTRLDFEKIQKLFSHPDVVADMRKIGARLEDVIAKLVADGERLHATVGSAETITDDRTIVDFLVPRLENKHALGGGIAYSSPMRTAFEERWRMEEAPQSRTESLFPFHPPAHHDRRAEASLRAALDGFPRPFIETVVATRKVWTRLRRR